MSLVTLKELLEYAEKKNAAVGAFSVGNMEMVMGAVRAAEETGEPIILQIAEKRLSSSPLHLMAPMMLSAAKNAAVPIAVHLDHGLTMGCIEQALSMGFTSVMLDASLLSLDENIRLTRKVVQAACVSGASVEAELGVVGGNEGDTAVHTIQCTDPDTARMFAEETGVDALAVAIGNAHGNYPRLPELRFDILEQIHRRTPCPLVLHGGTGITPEMFRRAIALGVRKINIATASFDSLAQFAKQYCGGADTPDYFALSAQMAQGAYENILRHIRIFSCR